MFKDGADMVGVLKGIADELETLRRPEGAPADSRCIEAYMQALVDSGQLVDDNGEKLKDLNGMDLPRSRTRRGSDRRRPDIKELLEHDYRKQRKDGAMASRTRSRIPPVKSASMPTPGLGHGSAKPHYAETTTAAVRCSTRRCDGSRSQAGAG